MKKLVVHLIGVGLLVLPAHSQTLLFDSGQVIPAGMDTHPVVVNRESTAQWYREELTFAAAEIKKELWAGKEWQILMMDGMAQRHYPGAPQLPLLQEAVVVPPGGNYHIEIPDSVFTETAGFSIPPAAMPALDLEGAPEPERYADSTIYLADAFYPPSPVEVVDTMLYRGIPVLRLAISPVQYNPVTGVVRLWHQLTINLVFDEATSSWEKIAEQNSKRFLDGIKLMVRNPGILPEPVAPDSKSLIPDAADYIIIVQSGLLPWAEQLADWRRQTGYRVEIVSSDQWTPDQVKEAIQSRYDAWTPHPDYFVILGDHTGPYAVPGAPAYDPYYGEEFATDLIYACMDGDDDWHPDMAHGRISVSSPEEATRIIDKIITYEEEPVDDDNFYNSFVGCAQYQDDNDDGYADRRFVHTSEDIFTYLTSQQGYTGERIYYTDTQAPVDSLRYNNGYYSNGELLPAEIRTTSFNWQGGAAEITSAINQGKFLVYHRDHGYVGGSGWAHPYYTVFSMESLTNDNYLPVVLSINCHTGEFQQDNCFAEKLLRLDGGGAVGVVAAAYYSYSGYNDAFSIGLIDAVWPDPGLSATYGSGGSGAHHTVGAEAPTFTMGEALNLGLLAMELNWGGTSASNMYTYKLFHWFGDPAMRIWKTNPNHHHITAVHPDTLWCDQNLFPVSQSEPGAIATLVLDDRLIGMDTLDENGNGLIHYVIDKPGDFLTFTITKPDCLVYEGDVVLEGPCSFTPEVVTLDSLILAADHAIVFGEILDDFGAAITSSGVLFGTSPDLQPGAPGVQTVLTNPVVQAGEFSVTLDSLELNKTYYYRTFAVSENGTGYGQTGSFDTFTAVVTIPYQEDFESLSAWPSGWSTDNPDIWGLRTQWYGQSNPGGYHVFSDYYPSGTGTVYSPVIDASQTQYLQLSFYHYWKADYAGYSQDGYLYGSIDGGMTWPYLLDEWHHNVPPEEEGLKTYDITDWAAGEPMVRFKWVVTHNSDWYWEFDNVVVSETMPPGIWTGIHSGDWFDPRNWSQSILPDKNINVTIPASPEGFYYPDSMSQQEAWCNNLHIEAGAQLEIPAGCFLHVEGDLINDAGDEGLVLRAASPGVAAGIIHHSQGVSATVESYLSQNRWHLIGPPVINALSATFYIPGGSDIYLAPFNASTGNWGEWITALDDTLRIGTGYECWVDDNVNRDEKISYKGVLVGGDFTFGPGGEAPLVYGGTGFNLLSNPYTVPVQYDPTTWDMKNILPVVWVWDESAGNYRYWGYSTALAGSGFGTLPNGIIPPHQGFFVLAVANPPILTIKADSRLAQPEPLYKNSCSVSDMLTFSVQSGNYHDEAIVVMSQSGSPGYQPGEDFPKLYGLDEAPQIYSFAGNQPVSLNVTEPDYPVSIPLEIRMKESGEYNLVVSGGHSFDPELEIWLNDLENNVAYNLRSDTLIYGTVSDIDNPRKFLLTIGRNIQPDDVISEPGLSVVNGKIIVDIPSGKNYRLEIFDLTGRLIQTFNGAGPQAIDISGLNLDSNLALARLTSEGYAVTKKLAAGVR